MSESELVPGWALDHVLDRLAALYAVPDVVLGVVHGEVPVEAPGSAEVHVQNPTGRVPELVPA